MLQAFQQWHAIIFQAKKKKIIKNLLHELLRSQFEFLCKVEILALALSFT